jgi:hypothetical protein
MPDKCVPPPRQIRKFPPKLIREAAPNLAPVSFPLGNVKEFSYIAPSDGSIEKPGLHVGDFEGAAVATLLINGEEKGKYPMLSGATDIPVSIPVKRMDRVLISFDRELPEVTVVFLYKVTQ